MPKMDSLKWIPKLLNAYIEAKVEQETTRRLRELSVTDESSEEVRAPKTQRIRQESSARSEPRREKRGAPVRRFSRRRPLSTRAFWESGTVSLVKGPSLWVATKPQKGGISSARERQRQLGRLESIRQQLAMMQRQLDRELSRLKKRMEEQ
jgi:uncharacterized protein YbaP (TraB family)